MAAAGTAMEYMQTVLDTAVAAVALAVAVTAVASESSGRKEKGTDPMLIKDEMEESNSCSGIFN